jgi:hypothetical protein
MSGSALAEEPHIVSRQINADAAGVIRMAGLSYNCAFLASSASIQTENYRLILEKVPRRHGIIEGLFCQIHEQPFSIIEYMETMLVWHLVLLNVGPSQRSITSRRRRYSGELIMRILAVC